MALTSAVVEAQEGAERDDSRFVHAVKPAVWCGALARQPADLYPGSARVRELGLAASDDEALPESTWRLYRTSGWQGPLPRACPSCADSMGWRYPASAGMPSDALTTREPDWTP